MKKIALAAIFAVGAAAPAAAQLGPATIGTTNSCVAPTAPASINGATSTKDQMVAQHKLVVQFMADSDTYQKCIETDVEAKADQAKKTGSNYDPKPENEQGDANQKLKEQVGADFNKAVGDFKAAQATAPKPAQ